MRRPPRPPRRRADGPLRRSAVQLYPAPFPELTLERVPALVALANRHRWQTRVDDRRQLVTEFEQGCEQPEDLRKLEALLEVGCGADGRDEYGRTPLCLATSAAAVDLLLANGASPQG